MVDCAARVVWLETLGIVSALVLSKYGLSTTHICLSHAICVVERSRAKVRGDGLVCLTHVLMGPPVSCYSAWQSIEGRQLSGVSIAPISQGAVIVCLRDNDFDRST